jgi:ATP-dependent DNA helicase RecG
MVQVKNNKIKPDMPVQYVKKVGPARAKIFASLGIETVRQLLDYFPRDWEFAPEVTEIKDIKPCEEVSIFGMVESTDLKRFRRPAMFEAMVADESGVCRIIWFHGGYLQKQIKPFQTIIATGKVTEYKHQLQLTNPRFMIVSDDSVEPSKQFSGGVYPATGKLSSRQIKSIIRRTLDDVEKIVEELFDEDFRKRLNLIDRFSAYRWIHNPPDEQKIKKARRRLKFDELFLMQMALGLRRYNIRHYCKAVRCVCTEKIDSRIRKRFPFLLTEDQDNTISEITADMSSEKPMNRLLQGDVGSGKTVVALYAALLAVANKKQVAIMAPTSILANQHFISIERYLRKSKVKRICITGGLTGEKRKQITDDIKKGKYDIVVGTVALLQGDIDFSKLGLVVIDEQHKFGVEQRQKLRKKIRPHCLVMTATPIPRTLAMTVFGDLDVSVIKHSPPGRGEVITRWVDKKHTKKAQGFIRQRLKAGKQAYFVYPRVSSSESGEQIKAAVEEYKYLNEKVYPEFEVALLHGRMSSRYKDDIMQRFRKNKINVLLSTVVIEVGVDVPNATVMVIEEADRFGLATLHQLRGRIGRGQSKSWCFLFAETDNELTQQRLDVMTRSNDGFEIAEQDLKIRGPGELFSTRQHGLPDLKIANIVEDYELLSLARREAMKIIEDDPMLTKKHHLNIRKALIEKFGASIGLADVG